MAYFDQQECYCRNCGFSQNVGIANGEHPPLDEAIATCNNCGFKSIWYHRELNTKAIAEIKAEFLNFKWAAKNSLRVQWDKGEILEDEFRERKRSIEEHWNKKLKALEKSVNETKEEIIKTVREYQEKLSATEKTELWYEITKGYCQHCGDPHPDGMQCQCWNDE